MTLVASAPATLDSVPARPAISANTKPEAGAPQEREASFQDLLDIVNPLQHIPVVSHLYRKLTGQVPSSMSQVIGDGIYGGPIGLIFSAFYNSASGETAAPLVTERLWALITNDAGETEGPVAGTTVANAPTPPTTADQGPQAPPAQELALATPEEGTAGQVPAVAQATTETKIAGNAAATTTAATTEPAAPTKTAAGQAAAPNNPVAATSVTPATVTPFFLRLQNPGGSHALRSISGTPRADTSNISSPPRSTEPRIVATIKAPAGFGQPELVAPATALAASEAAPTTASNNLATTTPASDAASTNVSPGNSKQAAATNSNVPSSARSAIQVPPGFPQPVSRDEVAEKMMAALERYQAIAQTARTSGRRVGSAAAGAY